MLARDARKKEWAIKALFESRSQHDKKSARLPMRGESAKSDKVEFDKVDAGRKSSAGDMTR